MDGDALVDRVRAALSGRDVREVRMFGGLSFMVDERMLVAARRGGELLVRLDPSRHEELVQRPGARAAVMGRDRPMGAGWISVDGAHLATSAELDAWLRVALAYHQSAQRPRA